MKNLTTEVQLIQIIQQLDKASKNKVLKFAQQELIRMHRQGKKNRKRMNAPAEPFSDNLEMLELAYEYCQF